MRLSRAWLLTRKEWSESFNSPMPYITMALFFVVMGWFWTSSLFVTGQATLREFFSPLPLILSVFMPGLTMRLFAEEYKTGTIESLATLPLEDGEIVLGKYGAALAVWALMTALSGVFGVMLLFLGPPDVGQTVAGWVGMFLLGAFYAALGVLASSLTRSQVVAFLTGFMFCFAFFLLGRSAQFVPGVMGQLLAFVGVDSHAEAFLKGLVDTRDVIYYLSGIVLALAGTLAVFHSRRWR